MKTWKVFLPLNYHEPFKVNTSTFISKEDPHITKGN